MTPYLEACFLGGGRIGLFCNRNLRKRSGLRLRHEPESTESDIFLHTADSARYPQRPGIRDLRTA